MTRDELIEKLKQIRRESTGENDYDVQQAIEALLMYINDHEVTIAFTRVGKWYA